MLTPDLTSGLRALRRPLVTTAARVASAAKMTHPECDEHTCITFSKTSHPDNPVPEEPTTIPLHIADQNMQSQSSSTSLHSLANTSGSDNESPGTPLTDPQDEEAVVDNPLGTDNTFIAPPQTPKKRRASTVLISQSPEDVHRILSPKRSATTREIGRTCCGGGCCYQDASRLHALAEGTLPLKLPDNDAFRSLELRFGPLSLETELTHTVDVPPATVSFKSIPHQSIDSVSSVQKHPPKFVTPHPPHEVFSARVHHARELTKPGAEKRTYHFDLDVTDYPAEGGDVDFIVGGAIGVQAPNSGDLVDEVFDLLSVPRNVRDRPVVISTTDGRWPTIWGDEMPRELATTRRELLTWCSDLQSYPPTKALLRLLAEHAGAPNEKKALMYLCSALGQPTFCDLRTGPHITIAQLLHAFPSSQPPLDHLLSVLTTLMPRFYSLSQDPLISRERDGGSCRRLIEIAVTVHEAPNWRGGPRTGVGSGFLERTAKKFMQAEQDGLDPGSLDLRVPMFRGLMANPLAREFVTDGPMLLIGAGVGIAPFRGFVQRRLRSANCANKVWVSQGIRDSLVDEIYNGEWGVEEEKVKKVVQSRRGGRYVQDEVRHQADLVWFVVNALDGRVFVCGSSKGMGEGVETSLVDVAMDKGNLRKEEATEFWDKKKEAGQYIAVRLTPRRPQTPPYPHVCFTFQEDPLTPSQETW